MGFIKITEEEWVNFLSEMHFDPDLWCNYVPEDFGFQIKKENK